MIGLTVAPPAHAAGTAVITGKVSAPGAASSVKLAGGPVETFKVGESFFEPPGAIHLVSLDGEQQGLAKSAIAAVLFLYCWLHT